MKKAKRKEEERAEETWIKRGEKERKKERQGHRIKLRRKTIELGRGKS